MNACKKTIRNLVAFLYGELKEREASILESHLEVCPDCREELGQLKEIYRVADSLTEDMERAANSIDWAPLPVRMAERMDERQRPEAMHPRKKGFWPILFQPSLRFVYAGLLLGLIAGSLTTFLILRAHFIKTEENGKIVVPQGFYEKMELEMARRQTLDYLLGSEYLLLDFVQSSPERSAEFWQSDFAAQKTKDLLSKKKYIDPQLDKFQLAKAKAICDQIELLFFELMQISEKLSNEELQMIQNLIEKKQLLLKIKLVRRELEKSEV